MRTVKIEVEGDFCSKHDIPYVEFYRAIGYLSMWNMNHSEVRIYAEYEDPNMLAEYGDGDKVRFVLAAIWRPHEQQYSFHS